MAIAVIGGLISSTVLSLVFVPAVFVLMDEIGHWLWRLFSRFIEKADEEPTGPSEPSAVQPDVHCGDPQEAETVPPLLAPHPAAAE